MEPQTTPDKATVIVGKKTGNKTCISKGAGAGVTPFTQPDKGQSLKRPRAAAPSGWHTRPSGSFPLVTGQGVLLRQLHHKPTRGPLSPGIREGDDLPQFRSQCGTQRRLTTRRGQDSRVNCAKRWLCYFKLCEFKVTHLKKMRKLNRKC